MNKIVLLCLVLTTATAAPAFSQTYKTLADTAKLNKEYVSVSNSIADLTARLTIARNDLPGYQSKAVDANEDAQKTAEKNTEKAAEATNGSVRDAKRARRQARRSVRDAKDSRNAQGKVSDQEKKIDRLSSELDKKQRRLDELTSMRTTILSSGQ